MWYNELLRIHNSLTEFGELQKLNMGVLPSLGDFMKYLKFLGEDKVDVRTARKSYGQFVDPRRLQCTGSIVEATAIYFLSTVQPEKLGKYLKRIVDTSFPQQRMLC